MIKEINYSIIKNYIHVFKKEGLIFCKNTKYYGYFQENRLIGITGILIYKNKCVFKNHYVFKEFRKTGVFKKLFQYSINIAKNNKIKVIEANCTDMSINHYLKNGFKIIKQYKNCKMVINENI